MSDMKCRHEWEYFYEHDFPNGYEYDQWDIPHKRCKKCGREYELFDGYGEYAKRWRKVEYCSPELHKLEQELIRTRKALDIAVDMLKLVYQGNGDPQDIMRYKDNRWTAVRRLCMQALDEITALKQKE